MEVDSQEINVLMDSTSIIKEDTTLKEDKIKVEKYARHFEYISQMTSFEDQYFKTTIRSDLLKDRNMTWAAFKSLTPEFV
jgi:hypothetical protein